MFFKNIHVSKIASIYLRYVIRIKVSFRSLDRDLLDARVDSGSSFDSEILPDHNEVSKLPSAHSWASISLSMRLLRIPVLPVQG